MSGALLHSLREISDSLPDRVGQCAAATAQRDGLAEGVLGLAIRVEVNGVLVLVLAGDERTARNARSQVRAFLGPSYARGRAPSAYLPPGAAFTDEVNALAAGAPVQAVLIPTELADAGLQALDRMMAVRERQPQTATTVPRPLARILRDFEDAIERTDLASAATLVSEATSTGRLSLVNRSLLESRILTTSGDFDAAIEHAIRHRLPDLRLPGPVEHDLIRACWQRWLAEPFQRGIEAARDAYREDVAPKLGGVFRDHRLAASHEARLAWLIHYATIEPVPLAAMREVIAEAPKSERPALEATLSSQPPAEPAAKAIRELQHGGENAAAYVVAREEPDLEAVVRIDALTRTAARLDDPVRRSEAQEIRRSTKTAAAPDRGEQPTEGHSRASWAVVDDWGSWLAALYEDSDNPDATKVRRRGTERWTEILDDDAEVDSWAGPIEVLAGVPAFRDAVPDLVRAVLPTGPEVEVVARRRQPVLSALAYALSSEPAPGSADLDAIADVAGALLVAGIDAGSYLELAGQMEQLFVRLAAPARLARWVVDVVELLLTSPAPAEDSRDAALRRLIAPLLPDAARARPLVPSEVWAELVELLEGRQGLDELLGTLRRASGPQEDDPDVFAALRGRSVLLHTLVAAAGERARAYLQQQVDTTVWADVSKVASNQLRDRARRAAIVVVASKAAKHAAYDAIKAAAGDRLHYASGKGWSSLVTAVRQALMDAA